MNHNTNELNIIVNKLILSLKNRLSIFEKHNIFDSMFYHEKHMSHITEDLQYIFTNTTQHFIDNSSAENKQEVIYKILDKVKNNLLFD